MAVKKTATRSRELSDSVIDTIRESLIILDHDLRVVMASRSFYEFFKVKPEETVGQLIYDLGNKQWDIPKLRELLETILPQKTTFDNYEVEHEFATIGRRIMLLNARQIQRVSGKERIILLAIEDITERKFIEKKMVYLSEQNELILTSVAEGILGLDLEGNHTFVNSAAERMLGYKVEELIGCPSHSTWHHTKPDGSPYPREECKILATILKGAVHRVSTEIFWRKDDTSFPVEYTSIPIYKDGRKAGVVVTFTDITKRKRAEEALLKSEEKYRTILETIQEGYFEVDLTGNFTFFNDSICRLLGYTQEEMMGMNNRQYTDKEHSKILYQAFNKVYSTGKPSKEFDWQIIKKDGTKRYVEASVSLQKDSSGKPIGFRGIARDITDRKMMEAEILALSITDQLTGLYNRRGFLSLAAQQLKLAKRNKGGMLLFFADLDGLKWINDALGHEEGDEALIETATVFKETFRTSDIIARLGGDEYAALTVDITEAKSELFAARLQSLINTLNNQKNRRYRLSISVGCSYYDPENPCSLDELMAHADKSMYEQKQNKKSLLPQTVHPSSGPLDIIQR
jgi:diguanylate cyclase (GGDEF)-like protein/PAS domain S-box-containing protein